MAQALLVQAYMVLQAKQQSVQRRLSAPSLSSRSSGTSSPDLSPEEVPTPSTSRPSRTSLPTSPRRSSYQRRPSFPTIPETLAEHDVEADEGKLFDISQRIKITLMELMNCESVKKDDRMRAWVQSRLDAQPPLSFRRESSTSSTNSERRTSYLTRSSRSSSESTEQLRKLWT